MTITRPPYYDQRAKPGTNGKPDKPWIVTVRRGTTGSLIEHHRFHHPDDAEAFYKEHRAEGENWVEYPPYEEKEGT